MSKLLKSVSKYTKLDYVQLWLENLEVIEIPANAFTNITLTDINEQFSFSQYSGEHQGIINLITARQVSFILNLEKIREQGICLEMNGDSPTFPHLSPEEQTEKAIERIATGKDISSLSFHFNNGEHEEIYVPWKDEVVGELDCTNVFQKTDYCFVNNHSLCVNIKEEK